MKEEQLKYMLDEAEKMGWKRGRLEGLLEILKHMEQEKQLSISYKEIKAVYNVWVLSR